MVADNDRDPVEERLAREVEMVKTNRSDKLVATSPAPLVPLCRCGWPVVAAMDREVRRRRREAQGELFLFAERGVGVCGKWAR